MDPEIVVLVEGIEAAIGQFLERAQTLGASLGWYEQ
jgi:hypothetical protein